MTGEKADIEMELVISNSLGMHARPAATLVQMASGYDAEIELVRVDKDGATADCRSVLSMLMLAAPKGTKLLLRASGPQADEAARAIARFFAEKFGEE